MQGIVDPLRAQVNELMGFKQGMEDRNAGAKKDNTNSVHSGPLNATASTFPPPTSTPVSNTNTAVTSGGGGQAVNGSSNVGGGIGLDGNLQELIMNALSGMNLNQPPRGQYPPRSVGRGRGRFNNGRWSNNNNTRWGNPNNNNNNYNNRDGNSFIKCSVCTAANAWSCNHCLICHGVDHRIGECPHKDDPTYIPKN